MRDEAVRITGGHVEVELFEQTLFEVVAGQPREGASLLVTRVSMDPATVDRTQAYFQKEVLPQIRTSPGVVAIRNLINRETGDAMTGVVYTDRAAMEAGVKTAEERQRGDQSEDRVARRGRRGDELLLGTFEPLGRLLGVPGDQGGPGLLEQRATGGEVAPSL